MTAGETACPTWQWSAGGAGGFACPVRRESLLRKAFTISAILLWAAFLFAQNPITQKKKAPPKSTAKKSSSKKSPARSSGPYWRSMQRAPSPERYKEIQQALANKGYLQTASPNGIWDSNSVEALKKFQQDQNLGASGKIDSLSLIALGLGPRRDPQPAPQQ